MRKKGITVFFLLGILIFIVGAQNTVPNLTGKDLDNKLRNTEESLSNLTFAIGYVRGIIDAYQSVGYQLKNNAGIENTQYLMYILYNIQDDLEAHPETMEQSAAVLIYGIIDRKFGWEKSK